MSRKYEQLDVFAIAPMSPGVAPEQKPVCRAGCSGWLERYCVIRCKREYWYWRYCWREADGKVHHKHVASCYVGLIAAAIAKGRAIAYILTLLKFRPKAVFCSGAD
jgi:hypothetical protein